MAIQASTTLAVRPRTTIPFRRELMGAVGFTALAGIAAVAIAKPDAPATRPHPKTPLLALCASFMALQADLDVLDANKAHDHEQVRGDLIDHQEAVLDQMTDLQAVDMIEQLARARVLLAWYGDDDMEWARVRPVFRDLLGASV